MSKSQIFFWLCLAFLIGVLVQSLINFPRLLWLGILIFGVAVFSAKWERKNLMVAAAILMVFSLGALRSIFYEEKNFSAVSVFNDRGRVVLMGTVIAEPDIRAQKTYYRVAVEKLNDGWKEFEISGRALVAAEKYPPYAYGDDLRLEGYLKAPEKIDDFDYPGYLAKENIYSLMSFPEISFLESGRGNFLKEKLFSLKAVFKKSLEKNLAEPQNSFLAGLLLGEKRNLPADFSEALSLTGTTHLVALSRYNITIIASSLMGLLNFFLVRRFFSFWISAAAIILFVILTGAAASAVRAAVMGILVLVAQQNSRLYSARNALIFAGALMIWFNPKILVFDLGFQLSFLATLGLLYLAPIFQKWLVPPDDIHLLISTAKQTSAGAFVKSSKALTQILSSTLAAQLAVLPLLVINFGRLSLIAPLANVLVLLFIPATMFFGFLAALAGIFWNTLGEIFSLVAWLFLSYEIKVIEILAKLPLAAVKLKLGMVFAAVYYLILFWLVRKFQKNDLAENFKK